MIRSFSSAKLLYLYKYIVFFSFFYITSFYVHWSLFSIHFIISFNSSLSRLNYTYYKHVIDSDRPSSLSISIGVVETSGLRSAPLFLLWRTILYSVLNKRDAADKIKIAGCPRQASDWKQIAECRRGAQQICQRTAYLSNGKRHDRRSSHSCGWKIMLLAFCLWYSCMQMQQKL